MSQTHYPRKHCSSAVFKRNRLFPSFFQSFRSNTPKIQKHNMNTAWIIWIQHKQSSSKLRTNTTKSAFHCQNRTTTTQNITTTTPIFIFSNITYKLKSRLFIINNSFFRTKTKNNSGGSESFWWGRRERTWVWVETQTTSSIRRHFKEKR